MAPMMRLKFVTLVGAAAGLVVAAGCSHTRSASGEPPAAVSASGEPVASKTIKVVRTRDMTDAALQPFTDIGLLRGKIPALLKAIKTPYDDTIAVDCETIGSAIQALDVELGPDVDVRLAEKKLREKGVDAAGDALVDAVESTSTSVIPFRGLVREVSGASGRDRRLAAAVQAGKLRRAYLKGVGQTLGCLPPAAPLPYER